MTTLKRVFIKPQKRFVLTHGLLLDPSHKWNPAPFIIRKIETKNCHLSTNNISKHFSVFVISHSDCVVCPRTFTSSFVTRHIYFRYYFSEYENNISCRSEDDCDIIDWTDDGGGDTLMLTNDKCSKCLVKGRIHYNVTVDISSLMSRHNTNNTDIIYC